MKEKNELEIIKEGYINNSLRPVSLRETEIIINQMKYSICKINLNRITGTGFFCKIKNIPFLITNYHVLPKNYLEKNKEIIIYLNNGKDNKIIKIKEKRKIITVKELDVTLIEIKPNLDKIDINNCLEIDDNIEKDDKINNNYYSNKSIYLIQYPRNENNIFISYGLLSEINGKIIKHLCNTDYGSSGSPILSLETFKIIGIHFANEKNKDNNMIFNLGIFIKYIILKLNEIQKSDLENETSENKYKEKIYNDGKYIGQLRNNKREGKGNMYYNNGDRYEGDWKNDLIEGKGIFYNNNGNKYEGDCKNDKAEGKGKLFYKNGNRYEGDFKNDLREGKGIMYYINGDKYEGDFKNDKKEGKGVYYFKNGNKYIGDWINNIAEGEGIISNKNGYIYKGNWETANFERNNGFQK